MVVTVELTNFSIYQNLVDQGSSTDVIYKRAFDQLKLPTLVIKPYTSSLVRFSGYFYVLITF